MRSAIILILAILSMVTGVYGAGGTITGLGTDINPYRIEDIDDFNVFAGPGNSGTYWGAGIHTKLMADVDLSGNNYTTAVVSPDPNSDPGYQGTAFMGVFDGNGHTISNMTIDTQGADNCYLGLFGKIQGPDTIVQNLVLENVNITGGVSSFIIGGLCGINDQGTISNCNVNGSISGSNELGGLCAINEQGTISNCNVNGTISGDVFLGGLCGSNAGSIIGCQAAGSISGSDYLGGLCGDNGGVIGDCHSSGTIIGMNRIGGLCGGNGGMIKYCFAEGVADGNDIVGGFCGENYGTISDSYSTGDVTGNDTLGGFCGNNNNAIANSYASGSVIGNTNVNGFCGSSGGDIESCFWDVENSFGSSGDDNFGAVGKTTAEMQTLSTFADSGWKFADYLAGRPGWYLPESDYPEMYWEKNGVIIVPDVTRMSLADAQNALTNSGLAVGEVISVESFTIPAGSVTGLSVSVGSCFDAEVAVDIYVSIGNKHE